MNQTKLKFGSKSITTNLLFRANIERIDIHSLLLRVFGLLFSSLLLFPQRFCRYVLRSSSGVGKDEDNSPITLNDKNQQASSQKFRQLIHFLFSNEGIMYQTNSLI